ncbi:DUF3883 domain-containing protein [bacterium]|nr:DUF3883 domain-containing protein [bacterium]MBU1613836.1 DUF3883 domain-containing protein [bacterium]
MKSMKSSNFQKLVKERKDWVRSSNKNNFDLDDILPGLYNDPSHFVYEMLQNAEDAEARKVIFKLREDKLDIYHNGNDFDFKDIEGVTGIGISRKKDDINAIGKFGVGFKSVFAITQTPFICSGDYSIKIEDFVIPSAIESNNQISDTKISLPFNHKSRQKDEVFSLVNERLKELGLKTLLFLKNIEEIQWETPDSSGHYLKSSEDVKKTKGAKRVTIISKVETEEYLVIGKPFEIEGKELKIEVAYKIGKDKNGKEIILPETDSKLVVFFPTERVTFLNFLIQGPYKTTPNRENISVGDKQNKLIVEETGKLIAESISIIKELGYLNTNFLNALPIDSKHIESEPIYSVIYEQVKAKLLSDEELLPTNDGQFTKASDALLARSKGLTEILNQEDIASLFSKRSWLDTNITEKRTRELWDYLTKELKIDDVDFEDFAKNVTSEFFESKKDEWMIDFYSRLLGPRQRGLWEKKPYSSKEAILRTKPIIRLEDDSHITPFDSEGNIQVCLPTESKSRYNTVKKVFVDHENSLEFLTELGLSSPDLFDEIRKFVLPEYQKDEINIQEDKYLEDFEKLLIAFNKIESEERRKEFTLQLSGVAFVKSANLVTRESKFLKPAKVYLSTDDLQQYFEDYPSAYLVSDGLYSKFGEDKLNPFLKAVGAEDKPRRIKFDPGLTEEKKKELRKGEHRSRDIDQKDYEFEGLDHFLQQPITIKRSALLWKFLLKHMESFKGWRTEEFFEGKYSWQYYSAHSQKWDAKFLITLQQTQWLVDKNNNLKRPSEISVSELPEEYIKESLNIDILKEKLRFKPDVFDQLSEDDQKRLKHTKGLSPEEVKEACELWNEKRGVGQDGNGCEWKPEYEPDEIEVTSEEVFPGLIESPDLEGQEIPGGNGKPKPKPPKPIPPKKAKEIGLWGEKYVLKALKEQFKDDGIIEDTEYGFRLINSQNESIEVRWLNVNSNVGKGYDFVIKKNTEEVEYIEVKTKQKEEDELIGITGTQWEFARKLFNQGEGDKYWIYTVVNAGQTDTKIKKLKNPIELWKGGRLYAHPIHFKL